MKRLLTILLAVSLLVVLAVPSAASAEPLRLADAKRLVAKEARKTQRELKDEGANRSSVPGCWRNSKTRVSCFISVWGYDEELDMKWQCMLRTVVRVNRRATRGAKRYRLTYGTPHCG